MLSENAFVSDRASNRYIDHALGADTGADLDFLVVCKHPISNFRRSQFLSRLMTLSARYPSGSRSPGCLDVLMIRAIDLTNPPYPARCEFIYGEWLRPGFEQGKTLLPLAEPVVTLMIAQARLEALPLSTRTTSRDFRCIRRQR